MEFKVNDKVIVKCESDINITEIGTIESILSEDYKIYGVNFDSLESEFVIAYHENELKKFEESIYPSTEFTDGKRTNIISRVSCSNKETVIQFEINKNKIKFNISKNDITLIGLLKILLNEININSYKYERVSPFKMIHVFEDTKHKFKISYPDLRNINEYTKLDIRTDDIIETDCNMLVCKGEYEIFIPNLLELARLKNVLIVGENEKEEIRGLRNEINRSKYLNKSNTTYINELIKHGFTIPERFNDKIENIDSKHLDELIENIEKHELTA